MRFKTTFKKELLVSFSQNYTEQKQNDAKGVTNTTTRVTRLYLRGLRSGKGIIFGSILKADSRRFP